MKKAIITNIQKYAVHDGPGIRTTVFLKGCPLKCTWCHNPETININKEMMHSVEKCTLCGECQRRCKNTAINVSEKSIITDSSKCDFCEVCIDFCIREARDIAGKEYAVNEVLDIIEKDRVFYDESGGGVTFSGGEAMLQIDFLEEIVKRCKDRGLSVAIDTCGQVPYGYFERIKDYVDLFLYDVKVMNSETHKKFMGVGNELILDNLKKLAKNGANINARIPLIKGVNDSEENIDKTIKLFKANGISKVNLLPYHSTGTYKYEKLGKQYEGNKLEKPSEEVIETIAEKFKQSNIDAKIGG